MEFRYIGKNDETKYLFQTMTFGSTTDEKEAFNIMDKAYENGIKFF